MFTVLSFLLAVSCLVPAMGKLASHPKMVAAAGHFGIPWSQYRLIGVAEVAAAGGVLARLVWPSLGIAAASGMWVLLAGALITHRRVGDPVHEAVPALFALALTIAYLAVALHS